MQIRKVGWRQDGDISKIGLGAYETFDRSGQRKDNVKDKYKHKDNGDKMERSPRLGWETALGPGEPSKERKF